MGIKADVMQLMGAFKDVTMGFAAKTGGDETVEFIKKITSSLEKTVSKLEGYLKAAKGAGQELLDKHQPEIDKYTGKAKALGKDFSDKKKEKGFWGALKETAGETKAKLLDKYANDAQRSQGPPEDGKVDSIIGPQLPNPMSPRSDDFVGPQRPTPETESKEGLFTPVINSIKDLKSSIEKLTNTNQESIEQNEEQAKQGEEKERKLTMREKLQGTFDKLTGRTSKRSKEVQGEKDGSKILPKVKGGGIFSKILSAVMGIGGIFTAGIKLLLGGLPLGIGKILVASLKGLGGVGTVLGMAGRVAGAIAPYAGAAIIGAGKLALTAATAVAGVGVAALATVAAVGLLIYGGYKLYKYLSRNSVGSGVKGKMTRLRLLSYGFNDTHREHYNKVFELDMLMKNYVSNKAGKPHYAKFDTEFKDKVLTLFEVKRSETEKFKLINEWFLKRYFPAHAAFMQAYYTSGGKDYVDDIDKLSNDQIFTFASTYNLPETVYDFTQIPVFDNPNGVVTKAEIDAMLLDIRQLAKKDSDMHKGKDPEASQAEVLKKSAEDAVRKKLADDNMTKKAAQVASGDTKKSETPTTTPIGAKDSSTTSQGWRPTPPPGDEGEAKPKVTTDSSSENKPLQATIDKVAKAPGALAKGDKTLEGIKGEASKESIFNLDPNVFNLFTGMAKEYNNLTGKSIYVTEAFRTKAEQMALKAKYGPRAAKPGTSLHEFGLAVDVNTPDVEALEKMGLLRKYGFTRPVGGETWHLEPAGVSFDPQGAKFDQALRQQRVLSSAGRGGGGLGMDPKTPAHMKYKRNVGLQRKLYDAGESIDLPVNPQTSAEQDKPVPEKAAVVQARTQDQPSTAPRTAPPNLSADQPPPGETQGSMLAKAAISVRAKADAERKAKETTTAGWDKVSPQERDKLLNAQFSQPKPASNTDEINALDKQIKDLENVDWENVKAYSRATSWQLEDMRKDHDLKLAQLKEKRNALGGAAVPSPAPLPVSDAGYVRKTVTFDDVPVSPVKPKGLEVSTTETLKDSGYANKLSAAFAASEKPTTSAAPTTPTTLSDTERDAKQIADYKRSQEGGYSAPQIWFGDGPAPWIKDQTPDEAAARETRRKESDKRNEEYEAQIAANNKKLAEKEGGGTTLSTLPSTVPNQPVPSLTQNSASGSAYDPNAPVSQRDHSKGFSGTREEYGSHMADIFKKMKTTPSIATKPIAIDRFDGTTAATPEQVKEGWSGSQDSYGKMLANVSKRLANKSPPPVVSSPKGLDVSPPAKVSVTQSNLDPGGFAHLSPHQAVIQAAKLVGMDPDTMLAFAQIESSMRPGVVNKQSSAAGLFQIVSATWTELIKEFGVKYNIPRNASPTHAYYNAVLGCAYAKKNLQILGPLATNGVRQDVALYIAHHFGATGGKNILLAYNKTPDAPMQSVVSAKAFYANKQELSGKTIAQYIEYLNKKLTAAGAKAGAGAKDTPPPPIVQRQTDTSEGSTDNPTDSASNTDYPMEVVQGTVVPNPNAGTSRGTKGIFSGANAAVNKTKDTVMSEVNGNIDKVESGINGAIGNITGSVNKVQSGITGAINAVNNFKLPLPQPGFAMTSKEPTTPATIAGSVASSIFGNKPERGVVVDQPSSALSLDKTESILTSMGDTLSQIKTILQSIHDKPQAMQGSSQQEQPQSQEQSQTPIQAPVNRMPSTMGLSMSRKSVLA